MIRATIDHIATSIVTGALRSGQTLGDLAALAARFKLDATALGRALGTLESMGLIAFRPKGDVVVRDWERQAGIGVAPHFLRDRRDDPRTASVLDDLLHVRRALLAEAAAVAAERATPEQVAKLEQIVAAMDATRGDTAQLIALDHRFMGALIEATHSLVFRWLANTLLAVYLDIARARPHGWSIAQDHFAWLRQLLAALAARDPDAARAAVLAHLETTDPVVEAVVRDAL